MTKKTPVKKGTKLGSVKPLKTPPLGPTKTLKKIHPLKHF
jgi:hypothetical protein